MMSPAAKLLLPFILLLPSCSHAKSHSLHACNTAQVTYSAAPGDIESKISIAKIDVPFSSPANSKRVNSLQGTHWFLEVDPDYIKDGPWTTTLYLGKSDSDRVYLKASFKDHGNTFSAHWINEELLFVQVWWGQISSSDLILDVVKGRLVYDQLANYGLTAAPCS